MESANASGKLVIVPTPIGNLGDMTLRSLEALREADVVCAEDTRVTGKLLAHFGIEKRLARLDEAMIGSRAAGVVERVAAGEVVAYCSDAGMPGVSDPGLRLVAAAREAGVVVEVLPGASAAACAYVASGTVCPRFYFGGFFPRKAAEQRSVLEELRSLDAALVFYESPNRLVAALSAIAEVLPWREVAVCRELTKLHEEVARGTAAELRELFAARAKEPGGVRGEIARVIDAPGEAEAAAGAEIAAASATARAAELVAEGLRTKEVAKRLAAEFRIPRNDAYNLAMQAARYSRVILSERSESKNPMAATRKRPAKTMPPELVFIDGLEVWLTRKAIKNMHLRVKPPDGRIEVSAPLHLPLATIRKFVGEKRDWIERQQREIAQSPRAEAAAATPAEVAQWKAVVAACVPALIEAWEPIMGVKAGKIAYRNMTSRWGSCQPSTGCICINVRLALYPPECLEYVVVHELCHLLERGHGPRFHALMDTFMPDWKERRAKLR